jgi:hypothetical protein
MKQIITPIISQKLIKIVDQYKNEISDPINGHGKDRSDGELWASVLGQIAVVGSAAPRESLKDWLNGGEDGWFHDLAAMASKKRLKVIHHCLRSAGVRYASEDISKCKKTTAAAYNFEVLRSYGGPKEYFSKVARVPVEAWRIAVVSDDLSYIKNKGARDLLIHLGLVQQAIAFDSRLISVLKHVGAQLPPDLAGNKSKYKALETELIKKVCEPCGISGGHFDRILFGKKKMIVV